MYFKIACSNCGKSLRVRQDQVGRRGRCPYCQTPFTVPDLGADVPMAAPRADDPPSRSVDAQSSHPPARLAPSGFDWADSTNVSLSISAAIALAMSLVFYLAVLPFNQYYLGQLFLARGWVPFALVFLMAWSVAVLLLKSRKLRRQKDAMLFDMLPGELGETITPANLAQFADHVRGLPMTAGDSFLVNRVQRGLEHFSVRRSASEVADMLTSQSDIDANAVESSYTLVKVFTWAIPILGFIGTVIGISAAVGSFSGELENAQDIAALKDKLGEVTGGLGVAFDTTLIALVMSLLVSFPASAMQKAEEDLLNRVDEYCNENLLKRLEEGERLTFDEANVTGQVRQAIDAALAGRYGPMLQQIDTLQQRMAELQTQQVERLQSALTGLAERTDNAHEQLAGSMVDAADSLRGYFAGLEQGIGALNDVLTRLGEKQVVFQTPPKRRWWQRGRDDNGGAADG